jgi:LDH2 family malate/lactate/ureidoglycolate dehydrogenase
MISSRYSATELTALGCSLLTKAGVPDNSARLVADSLVEANLRGVDSHGIQMLLPYLDQLAAGTMDAGTRGKPASESGACLVYDGENGLGQVVAHECVGHALRLAREDGVAVVTARNSNHFGAAAYWAQKLTAEGCMAIVTSNASPAVPPWGGKEPRLGTNPLCMAVPGSENGAWLLDMATTTVSLGKMHAAHYRGETTLPAGWATDQEGVPTTDMATAIAGLPTPLGGYKGTGLSLMAELLSAGLSGGPMSTDVGSLRRGFEPLHVSHTFVAIDMRRFQALDVFAQRLERLTGTIKSTAVAAGQDEVLMAGEPENRMREERLANGIPLPDALMELLRARG